MPREQFTFYRSFWDAIKALRKKEDRLSALEAIAAYALDGEERAMTDVAAGMFILIKPVLDAAEKKSKGGRKTSSNDEDTGKTPSSNDEDTGKEKEGEDEKEGEIEVEVENKCYNLPPTTGAGASAAVSFFLDRINPAPAGTVVQELLDFERDLGADVVLHALQIAVNDRKTAWSYIRAILSRYKADGLRDLPAVLESETRHEQDRQSRRSPKAQGRRELTREEKKQAAERDQTAMDQVRRLREKMIREA